MSPGEWIALVAVALSVVVPTLASWRSSAVRDARLEAKVDALLARVIAIENDTERHGEEDDRRFADLEKRTSRHTTSIARATDRLDRLEAADHRS